MTAVQSAHEVCDDVVVARQIGRTPREPWRVAVRCARGYPSVIASPSVLADCTPFPTHLWLTCPHLADAASAAESAGACAEWTARLAAEPQAAAAVRAVDARLRELRAAESGGDDACASVGLAGQRDATAIKCVHAHVAASLAGLADPIGDDVIARTGASCADERCLRLSEECE